MHAILPASLPVTLFALGAVLVAGTVRGYGGFGFSMIAMASLALVFEPARLVPTVLMLEVAASLMVIGRVWRQVAWGALGWLGAGVAAGTPAGVWILGWLPQRPMKIGLGAVILALAALLRLGFRMRRMPPRAGILAAGVGAGLLNGAAAVGGPPAVLFFFSSPAGAAVSRASLIAFFLGTDLYATLVCATMGLVTSASLALFGLLLPGAALGVLLGQRAFGATDPERFRRRVLTLLIGLSGVTLVRAVLG